jgi:SHAQKYF class myb-like DNA-binding protein
MGEEAGRVKRPRLVWTPQLHRRFVDVVAHQGIKAAVPKTIMQLMKVEGLTRENIASHLQRYRLYVKRIHRGRRRTSPTPTTTTSSPPSQSPKVVGLVACNKLAVSLWHL